VNRTIVGFSQDTDGDWVAGLDCGHGQHVRHRPPFVERAWVVETAERDSRIGATLDCCLCDRLEAPGGLEPYSATADFTVETVPAGLLRDHSTKAGVWGRIEVLAGNLRYVTAAPSGRTLDLGPGDNAMIPPELLHHVALSEGASFRVIFLKATR
jgi:tellurite methyltransferase